jgi:hypothetical protein
MKNMETMAGPAAQSLISGKFTNDRSFRNKVLLGASGGVKG